MSFLSKTSIERNPNYNIITKEQPFSIAAESYRRIKVGLQYSKVDAKLQVIQICSAMQGEGKSTVLLNMAQTYAEDGKKVIVIDFDFRRPKIHRAFGLEDKDGITDVLVNKIKLEDAIKHVDKVDFDCLNRGTKTLNPTALLSSNELKKIMLQLRNMYDIILVDGPPALAVSDCCVIAPLTDGCVFVVNQQGTNRAAAKDAVKYLKANNVNIIGCVFNDLKNLGKNGYYGYRYYSKYYKSYGYGYSYYTSDEKKKK